MTMKPFEIQSPSLSINGVLIDTSAQGKLVIPGVTRAGTNVAIEVEDTGDQSYSFGANADPSTITIIDGYQFAVLNGDVQAQVGWTAATYSADEIDGEGFIDGISVVDGGAGYTGEAVTYSQQMLATEFADPLSSFDPGVWTWIPFKVRCGAGEIESEFGGGNASTGDITFNADVISTSTGDTFRIESTTENADQNAIEFNNTQLDLYAYNDDSGSYSEVRLENVDNDYPWVLINVKAASQQDESRWAFAANGELTFPDGTKQTTAYTGGSSSGSSVTTSDTAPDNPSEGDLWFDSVSGQLYVYFENTWVDSSPSTGGGGSSGTSLPSDAAGVLKNDGTGTLSWSTLDVQDLTDNSNLLGGGGQGGTSLPSDSAGYLHNDGSGGLSWTQNTAGTGTNSFSDVWVTSTKASNFWTTYTLTGNITLLFNYGGQPVSDITLTNQAVSGKQITVGQKILVINDAASLNSNSYGIVFEFPSSPSVGDTFSAPVMCPTALTTISVSQMQPGQVYTVVSLGTTNWGMIGVFGATVGQQFQYNGGSITGDGTVSTSGIIGVSKAIFKPASGHRAISYNQGNAGSVTIFGQGATTIASYLDLTSGMGQQPITWVYAGIVDSIPTWYQIWG